MRKIIFAALAGLLLCGQNVLPGFPPGVFSDRRALDASIAAGCTVTCPGDLGYGTPRAFYGFRCYTYAYSGDVADIWDAATGSTTETLITCSNGSLVATSPTAIATTCAAGCVVKKLYDQSAGNNCASASCDLVGATAVGNDATFLYQSASCGMNSGLSCLQCPSAPSAAPLISANLLSSTVQTFYFSLVFYDATPASNGYIAEIAVTPSLVQYSTAAKISFGSGTLTTGVTAAASTWHSVQVTFAGASSAIDIDGSSTGSLNAGTTAASGKLVLCSTAAATMPLSNGYIAEWSVWPSASTFSASGMTTNQQSFYGGL